MQQTPKTPGVCLSFLWVNRKKTPTTSMWTSSLRFQGNWSGTTTFMCPGFRPCWFLFFVFCNCTIILKFRHIGEVEDDGNILPIWRGNRQFIFGGASFLVSPNWSDKNVHFITSSSPWSGFLLIFWAQNQQVQGGQTTVDASSLHHWTWRQAGPALFQSLGYLAFEVGGCGAQLPNFPWVFLQLWWIHEQKWESNH